MPRPSRVHRFKDNGANCWASIVLSSGEPCWISVSPGSVVVKRSRFGLFGALIYRETDGSRNASAAKAIARLLPANLLPAGFTNPLLASFANLALHSADISTAVGLINEALGEAGREVAPAKT